MSAWQFGNGNGNGVALANGSAVLAGDASVTISSAASLGSPANPRFMILIDSELIEVDAVAGNVYSSLVRGAEGTTAAGHTATATTFLPITAGMLSGAFLRADATNAVESTGTDFKPSGLTGATTASRYVGGTGTDAAPASGTFQLGDFAVSNAGRFYVCTAAGTPGTWIGLASLGLANTFTAAQTFAAAVTVTAEMTAKDFKATGVASLTNAQNARFVGSWTTSGPPAGLTAAVADWGYDKDGNQWYCTVAGTPGTWRAVGLHRLDLQTGAGPTASLTLTVPAASVGLYGTLTVDFVGKSDQGAAVAFVWQFNGDAGATAYWAMSVTDTNVTLAQNAPTNSGTPRIGAIPPTAAPAGALGQYRYVIENADSTTLRKFWHFNGGRADADAAANIVTEWGSGYWTNVAAAISTILMKGSGGNLVNFRAILSGQAN